MNKNFPDPGEDDSLINTESFGGVKSDDIELEQFAAPFSKIEEDEEDLPEINEPEVFENRATAYEIVESETVPIVQSPTERYDSEPFVEIEEEEPAAFESDDAKKDAPNSAERKDDFPIFAQSPYHSESSDETIRKSGLAYTAAIILLGAIVFTLILGWFADLLFGTSPWGKVGGIILGSIIGFIQFFRTTSQLVKNKD